LINSFSTYLPRVNIKEPKPHIAREEKVHPKKEQKPKEVKEKLDSFELEIRAIQEKLNQI